MENEYLQGYIYTEFLFCFASQDEKDNH